MPAPRPLKIKLSQQQRTLLEQVVRRHSSSQGLVQRAGVILSATKGMNNTQIAQQLLDNISQRSVGRFLKRGYSTTTSPSLLAQR